MIYTTGNRRVLTRDVLAEGDIENIIKQVESSDFEVIKVLKDHHRSKVSRIRLNDLDLVLKIPREKNTKPWIRFLTLFRSSEAFKNLVGMKLLNSSGFRTTRGYLACEYRSWGMVTDSWVLYHYLEGEECLDVENTYPKVVGLLSKMHSSHILHGDAQIRNFLLSEDDLFIIDANPSISQSNFKKAFEFAYLKRSQPEIEKYFGEIKHSKWYIFAEQFDKYERIFARKKRALKKTIGLTSI